MRFSSRIPSSLQTSPLVEQLRQMQLIDLTCSNPTRCGLTYPVQSLADALSSPDPLSYSPSALGKLEARAAIARCAREETTADQVVLCASTSEAYAWVFKLFCEANELVAYPAPSYPLISVIGELEATVPVSYRLAFDGQWEIDLASLEARVEQGARVIVMVQPNNPTGSCVSVEQGIQLADLCARYDAIAISDEVFAPYARQPMPALGRCFAGKAPLICLDGLSKGLGLPGAKLSWMIVRGADLACRQSIIERLEWVADAFLSVSALIQNATPRLMEIAPVVQRRINSRALENQATLKEALGRVPSVDLLPSMGGWSAVLRLPRTRNDDELVLWLAREAHVFVHSGYFYDFAGEGYVVISLLGDPAELAASAERLVDLFLREYG